MFRAGGGNPLGTLPNFPQSLLRSLIALLIQEGSGVVNLAVAFRQPAKRAKDRSPRRKPWEKSAPPTLPEPR